MSVIQQARQCHSSRRRLAAGSSANATAMVLLAATVLLMSSSGCEAPGKAGVEAATHADRLMRAYEELRAGRFVVIADFEDPSQMEIVQFIDVSDQARCVRNTNQGRRETGGHCLQWTAASSDDTVVFNNDKATNWYMKRDWRPYDLLLMSVYASGPDLAVDVLITAGRADQRLAVESNIALAHGWNRVRLDLAEVGEHIPLDDIREIRLSLAGLSKPVDVYLDDIILTGHRRNLMGNPKASDGSLYVQQVGRRWRIGTGGSFELTFSHGQIVEWFNLAADPYRLDNLVKGTVLGPTPVVLPPFESPEEVRVEDFSPLGETVVARQQIVEMSPVRAVIACEWHFVDDPDMPEPALQDRPFQRWVYTIYPTGRLAVAVECTVVTEDWTAPGLGLAVSLSSADEYELYVHQVAQLDVPEPLRHVLYATARSRNDDEAFLMYTVYDSHRTPEMISVHGNDRRRVSFIATGPIGSAETHQWQCQILLATAGEIAGVDVAPRALAYAKPAPAGAQGRQPGNSRWPTTHETGFDPASGCYFIKPEANLARFEIDGSDQPLFAPAFACWIRGIARRGYTSTGSCSSHWAEMLRAT